MKKSKREEMGINLRGNDIIRQLKLITNSESSTLIVDHVQVLVGFGIGQFMMCLRELPYDGHLRSRCERFDRR